MEYYRWHHVLQNPTIRKGASLGNARAQIQLGKGLLNGIGVEKNEEEGVEWLHKGVEANDEDSEAAIALGKFYLSKKQYKESFTYFKLGADDEIAGNK